MASQNTKNTKERLSNELSKLQNTLSKTNLYATDLDKFFQAQKEFTKGMEADTLLIKKLIEDTEKFSHNHAVRNLHDYKQYTSSLNDFQKMQKYLATLHLSSLASVEAARETRREFVQSLKSFVQEEYHTKSLKKELRIKVPYNPKTYESETSSKEKKIQAHQVNKPTQKIAEQTVTKPKETVKPIYVQPKSEVTKQEPKRPVNDKEIVGHSNNVSSNAPKIEQHLSHLTGDAAKHKQRCLDALREYKAERQKEASRPLNFFRNAFGKFDSYAKIECVAKMIKMLETDNGVRFEESDGLVMRDGRLGKIFKEYDKSIFTPDNFKVEERINNFRNYEYAEPTCGENTSEAAYINKGIGLIREKAGADREKAKALMVEFAVKYTPEDLQNEAEFRKKYLPEVNNVKATPVPIQNNMARKDSPKTEVAPQAAIPVATTFKKVRFEENVRELNLNNGPRWW